MLAQSPAEARDLFRATDRQGWVLPPTRPRGWAVAGVATGQALTAAAVRASCAPPARHAATRAALAAEAAATALLQDLSGWLH